MMSDIGILERRFSLSRKNSVSLESSDCDGLRDLTFDLATSFSAVRTSYASSIADRSTGTFSAARAYRKIIRNQTSFFQEFHVCRFASAHWANFRDFLAILQ